MTNKVKQLVLIHTVAKTLPRLLAFFFFLYFIRNTGIAIHPIQPVVGVYASVYFLSFIEYTKSK